MGERRGSCCDDEQEVKKKRLRQLQAKMALTHEEEGESLLPPTTVSLSPSITLSCA